jgi:DNA-binding transcriptional regulator YiaG
MEKNEQLEKQIRRLKKIRKDLGMNRTEFSHYVKIPLRTLEEWEAGRRQMPDYVLRILQQPNLMNPEQLMLLKIGCEIEIR